MRRQDWLQLFLILGVFFAAFGIGGVVKVDFMGIQIVGSLGAVIIVLTLLAALYYRYLRRKNAD